MSKFLIQYGGDADDIRIVSAESAEDAAKQFFECFDQHHDISVRPLTEVVRYFKRSVSVVEVQK